MTFPQATLVFTGKTPQKTGQKVSDRTKRRRLDHTRRTNSVCMICTVMYGNGPNLAKARNMLVEAAAGTTAAVVAPLDVGGCMIGITPATISAFVSPLFQGNRVRVVQHCRLANSTPTQY